MARINLDRQIAVVQRAFQIALVVPHGCAVDQRVSHFRTDRQRAVEIRQGFIERSLVAFGYASVVPGFGVARIKVQGAAVIGDGGVQVSVP